MKTILITLAIMSTLSFTANASEENSVISCSYATGSETKDKMALLESVGYRSVPELTVKIKTVIAELGYKEIGLTSVINCSNDNSKNIDFELLREAVINRLTGK